MKDKTTTALVLGASGMIGLQVVHLLLANPAYSKVYAVTRKKLNFSHDKLENIIADYDSIDPLIEDLLVDQLFSCLGSTQKKTPNRKIYYQIDHDYPLKVASLLKKNGCESVAIISSMGAHPNAKNFYLRMKGETDRDLIQIGFSATHTFRPSLLIGDRQESRFAEDLFGLLFKGLNLLLWGPLKDYKSIYGKDVASAMMSAINNHTSGVHIYKTSRIKNLA